MGRESCKECHEKEYNLFQGSDHDHGHGHCHCGDCSGRISMMSASPTSVSPPGSSCPMESIWYIRKDRMAPWSITRSPMYLGSGPCSNISLNFPGEGTSVFPSAGTPARPARGGQRWFHIYQDERIPPDDVLHWTRVTQNWNYMCAECHSTNLQKELFL